MDWKRFHRARPLVLVVVVSFAVIAAGAGYATSLLTGIPDDEGVFHACVNDASG